MRTRASLIAAAVLAIGGAAACSQATSGSPMVDSDGSERVQVRVENENWADMKIYAIRAGSERRLGRVTSLNSRTFDVPRSYLGSASVLRLAAEGLASGEATATGPIAVGPGEVVIWNLKNDLDLSSYHVARRSGAGAGG